MMPGDLFLRCVVSREVSIQAHTFTLFHINNTEIELLSKDKFSLVKKKLNRLKTELLGEINNISTISC